MKMEPITVGLCALVTILGIGAGANVKATNDVEKAINNKKPTIEQSIDNSIIQDSNITNNYTTNNYNDYSKEYNYYTDNDDDEENQKITDLETQMNLLKSQNDANEDYLRVYEKELDELKEQKNNSNKTTILAVNRGEYKQPWVGPQTHLCPYSAGWPAICGECGQQGGIHQDIIEWMDDNNNCHLTHKECFAKYCVNNNVWPNNHYKDKI